MSEEQKDKISMANKKHWKENSREVKEREKGKYQRICPAHPNGSKTFETNIYNKIYCTPECKRILNAKRNKQKYRDEYDVELDADGNVIHKNLGRKFTKEHILNMRLGKYGIPKDQDFGDSYYRDQARKIYQEYHQFELPEGIIVHHEDENWRNNNPDNLIAKNDPTHKRGHSNKQPNIWKTRGDEIEMYHSLGANNTKIARIMGCSVGPIIRWLKRNNKKSNWRKKWVD